MDYLTVTILVSFAAAFLVSVVDYWADLGIARAGIALGLSLIGFIPLNYHWTIGLTCALASSFLCMFLLQVVERMNFRAVGRMR